ncbi:hypothetical protein DB792_07060 [Staphylococcus warneri]|uniref:hypothetical protein n=1 Tax=Staphylococcus pasteuri TaxID=45972 RepID=UPI000F5E6896|nr:hypothetical protein [Staphylococcus pasteuri]RQX27430.1 hypothetical protein DB792_07060 [Staphylococcus warneri]
MEKSVKFAIGIYLAAILIVTTLYLSFILVGSLQGKDMSNSVLDTDHTKINNKTRNSDEAVDSSLKNEDASSKEHSYTSTNYKNVDSKDSNQHQSKQINNKTANSNYQTY